MIHGYRSYKSIPITFIHRVVLLGTICCIQNNFSLSQPTQLRFKHLSVEDGLSQSWVQCIFQDKYGYIWFGTGGNGVNKFNGYEFSIYKNNPKIKNSLSNNQITAIYEDRYGNILVGTQFGLNIYDRNNDCFYNYSSFPSQYITGFYETGKGKLYVITVTNIYKVDLKKNLVRAYCNSPSGCLTDIFVDAITEDFYGNLWVGSSNGLYLLDTLNKSFTIFQHHENDPASISENILQSLYRDTKGRVWVGTVNNGLSLIQYRNENKSQPYFINFSHDTRNPNSISKGAIRDMLDDGKGNLWIGTENGGLDILDLQSFENGNPKFNHNLNDKYNEKSLSNNSIYALLKDIQGTIWIGTYGGGVSFYNKLLYKFDHYYNYSENNIVNVIYEADEKFWIGTEGGLIVLNSRLNDYKVYSHNPNDEQSLGSDAVWAILKDSRNNLWIGTWAGGLNLFNRNTKTFSHFIPENNNPQSLGSTNVFGIIEDKDGYLWIACMNGGLNRYDYRTNTFRQYRADFQSGNSISGDWVQTILESSNGELWVSTSVGVDLFDKKTEQFIHFTNNDADSTSISYNGATVIFEDSKGNIWLGTEGGLNSFIREDSSFIYYQEEDGLPDNSVKGICEDDHGNLWLSTNRGLSKFFGGINRPEKPVFENYDVNDGLQGNEFNRRSFFKDKEGFMYFGGTNGFNVFHPDSLKRNTFIPPVVLTDFLLFNKPVKIGDNDSPLKSHIGDAKEITLSYKHTVITFKFAALDYLAPGKNQYKYFMKGFDEDWHEVGNKREVTYTNLDPGKYIFKVKGSNNDGTWNDEGVSLVINILPPWWQTIWFRFLVIIIAISLIIGFYYYRLHQLNRQKHSLQQMVKQRTREIEEKNAILLKQTDELNEINTILEERQQRIEEQAEELRTQAEKLSSTNNTLLTLNATKDKFFSIIAHDLKNPFSSILGFCEVLSIRYDKYDDTKRKHLIGIIDRSAQNVFKLLENLLQWSRSQTGNIKYTPEEFKIEEVIENILLLVDTSLTEKGLKLSYNVPKNLKIYADKNMIHTVIRNLITNSIKFSEAGEIKIEVGDFDSYTKISVIDTGVGIRKEMIDKIFEIEKSKSTEGTRGEPGTGLGLIICKEFIEKNGGKIGVESEFGKGSVFYFTLPKKNG